MVLITGGAGYIGSHTAVELLSAGYEIVIADNLSNSKLDVIDAIKQISGKNFVFYCIDVADVQSVDKIFREQSIDCIIHFAGYKAVGESVESPVKYYRNNIDTTLTLLETMQKYNVGRFIFSSSATVYGTPKSVPIPESAPVGNCVNPYGRTKFYIEQILNDCFIASPSMSIVLLRYFNPIGAHASGLIGEMPTGIPNNLMPYILQVAAGKLEYLNIWGNDYPTADGTGVRDYIHVVDLAKGHVASVKYAYSHSGINVFNLGTGKGYSVLDVVKTFERTNNITVPFKFAARRQGDVAECWADPNKAKCILNWRAKKTLEDMCIDSWRWQVHVDNILSD